MMQTKTLLLLIFSILLIVTNCKQKEITSEGDIKPSWNFRFKFADSLGNNLLPYNLPPNPVRNPNDFKAFCAHEIPGFGYSYIRHELYGYTFRFGFKKTDNIAAFEPYQKDSIIKFYVCFGDKCDTVIIKPNIENVNLNTYVVSPCGAEWVAWGSDTTYNHPCSTLPIKP